MNANRKTKEKKTIPFSPRQPSVDNTSTAKLRRSNSSATSSPGFCRRLGDCIVMGPVSPQLRGQEQPPAMKFNHLSLQQMKVEEMQKEVQKYKELKRMYNMKLEKTQVYLRQCLQVAQDNGFLDLILNKYNKEQESSVSLSITQSNISPPIPSPAQRHFELAALIDQAKMNGWYIEPNEIQLNELAAQGSTADIFRGRWRGVDVAVKCMYPDFFGTNENGVSFFAQEVETLSRQRHPFVLQLMGACLDPPQNCWIVTEFLCTDLKDWLHGPGSRRKERSIPLPPLKERFQKASEIAQAMQYLHESKPKILHRDLKPSNIFLDDALHVQIADFGHARFLSNEEKALTGETGTFVYMAPEVIRFEPYDEKCDVYSFGIILNELMTGEHPYIETDYGPSKIAIEVAENGLRPAIPKDDQQLGELTELIQKSWDEEPANRPSFAEITCNLRMIQDVLTDTS
ncbi:serine/threonine-protein kinase STY46-like [Forsythia ovata]|uniref:Serine/threonine-protein kinase STY46-like n=1 Tax=Forsythia ovata TaxID=205694 RepID=A0ABD1RMJ1_9LAMI